MACQVAVVSRPGGAVGISVRWESNGERSSGTRRRAAAAAAGGRASRGEVLLGGRGRYAAPPAAGCCEACQRSGSSGRDVYAHVEDQPWQPCCSPSNRVSNSSFVLMSPSCVATTSSGGRRRSEARQWLLVTARKRVALGGHFRGGRLKTERDVEQTGSIGFAVGADYIRQQTKNWRADVSGGNSGTNGWRRGGLEGGTYGGRRKRNLEGHPGRRQSVVLRSSEDNNQEESGPLTVQDGDGVSLAAGEGIESLTSSSSLSLSSQSSSSFSSSSSDTLFQPLGTGSRTAIDDNDVNGSSSSSASSSPSSLYSSGSQAAIAADSRKEDVEEDSTSTSSPNGIVGRGKNGTASPSAAVVAEAEDEDRDSSSDDEKYEMMKPVQVMRELFRAAVEELELLRAHSGALESEAQAVAERAVSLREEAEKMEVEADAAKAVAKEAAAGELESENLSQQVHAQYVAAVEKVRQAEADLALAIREARAWEEEVREKEVDEVGDDDEPAVAAMATRSDEGDQGYLLTTTDNEKEWEEEGDEQSETALEEDRAKGGGEVEEREGVAMATSVVGENEAEVSEKAEDLGRLEKGDGEAGDDAAEDGKKTGLAMMRKEDKERDEEEEEEEEEEKKEVEEEEEEDEEEVLKVSSDYAVMVERLRLEAQAIEKQMIEAREASRRAAVKAQMLREEAESAGERARAAWAEAMSAEELVGEAMLRAEMAVAEEVEACHRVSDAEIALQKAEKLAAQVESAAATLAAAEAEEKKALELAQAQVGGGGGLTKDAPEEGELAMVDVWFADDEEASEVVVLDREDKGEEEGRDEGGREDTPDGEDGDGMTVISEVKARDMRGRTTIIEADEMGGASNEGKKVGSASVDEGRGLAAGGAAAAAAAAPPPSAPGGESMKWERVLGLTTEANGNGGLGEVVDDIVDGLAAKVDSSPPSSLILGSGTGGVVEEKEVRKKEKDKEKTSGTALLLSPPSPPQTPTKREEEGGGLLGAGIVLTGKDSAPAMLPSHSSSSSLSSSATAAAAAVSPSLSASVPIPASGTTTTLVPSTSTKQKSVAATKGISERDATSAFGLGEKLRAFVKEHTVKILLAAALLAAGIQIGRMEIRQRIPSRSLIGASAIAPLRHVLPIGRSAGHSIQQYARKLTAQVNAVVDKISKVEHTEEEATLYDTLWLLLVSVIAVPLFQKLPGGSPVLGYLAGGALIGPHALSIIKNVNETKELAEFGVVFLLFTIGLELSLERLRSMKKFVFGLGTAQVFVTTCFVSLFARFIVGMPGPASMVLGSGLALSSTAVVIQVLQERGESTSLYGRATFSVLLLQDLAVVVLLILIPLLSQNTAGGAGLGMAAIGKALGVAAIKGAIAISAIIAGGRLFLRPIYRRMADNKNSEIFAATTLLVVLGTSVLTARAGLSMALGAFLAGLLLAETEYAPQVESDINPYRGLLLGLFFMTVGMSIDPRLLIGQFPRILAAISLLIVGKTALLLGLGRIFGLSPLAAARAGLVLAPGGEFAFVAFGEAVTHGIMPKPMSSMLFLVVGLSMAITPWLAAAGQWLASRFEQQDVRSLQPAEAETDDLQDHIIIAGFGRAGQMVAQLLSERLIPFVALDVRSERVSAGRAMDLPVYFGDAGSREVLHKVGAARAAAAVITLDTPGANYRTVWALTKHFPSVKTFVRAHDIDHAINLEKAGATAVVPETLEPSLQLAAAVLAQMKLPAAEIAASIDEFRASHLAELTEVAEAKGTCLGYGFSRILPKKTSSQQAGDNDVAGAPSIKSSASDGGAASGAADRKGGSADKYAEVVP